MKLVHDVKEVPASHGVAKLKKILTDSAMRYHYGENDKAEGNENAGQGRVEGSSGPHELWPPS